MVIMIKEILKTQIKLLFMKIYKAVDKLAIQSSALKTIQAKLPKNEQRFKKFLKT